MKTGTKTSEWTTYTLSMKEFIEKLGLAPDTDYISVHASFGKVEITTTRTGQR